MQRIKKHFGVVAIVALVLGAGGLVFGQAFTAGAGDTKASAFSCPLTGEQLPCGNCCPLDGGK